MSSLCGLLVVKRITHLAWLRECLIWMYGINCWGCDWIWKQSIDGGKLLGLLLYIRPFLRVSLVKTGSSKKHLQSSPSDHSQLGLVIPSLTWTPALTVAEGYYCKVSWLTSQILLSDFWIWIGDILTPNRFLCLQKLHLIRSVKIFPARRGQTESKREEGARA